MIFWTTWCLSADWVVVSRVVPVSSFKGESKLFRSRLHQRTSNSDGTAYIELTFVLPLIFIMIVGLVDVGRALINYLNLTQIAYEGARFAGALSGLESTGSLTVVDLHQGARDATAPVHWDVQTRIDQMLTQIYQLNFRPGSVHIRTGFDPKDPTNPSPQLDKNVVRITIDGEYESLFNFVNWWQQLFPVSVSISGPYLPTLSSGPPSNACGICGDCSVIPDFCT